jgi:hypothetical protein
MLACLPHPRSLHPDARPIRALGASPTYAASSPRIPANLAFREAIRSQGCPPPLIDDAQYP